MCLLLLSPFVHAREESLYISALVFRFLALPYNVILISLDVCVLWIPGLSLPCTCGFVATGFLDPIRLRGAHILVWILGPFLAWHLLLLPSEGL